MGGCRKREREREREKAAGVLTHASDSRLPATPRPHLGCVSRLFPARL